MKIVLKGHSNADKENANATPVINFALKPTSIQHSKSSNLKSPIQNQSKLIFQHPLTNSLIFSVMPETDSSAKLDKNTFIINFILSKKVSSP
jgi:hypothetical protein